MPVSTRSGQGRQPGRSPRIPGPRPADPAAPLAPPCTILVADPDAVTRHAVADCLRAHGHTVHLAQDGIEALTGTRELQPDVLILDIIMPQLGGDTVCWLLRQDPALRDRSIIAFSALDPAALRHFPRLGADAYVPKGPLARALAQLLSALAEVRARPTDLRLSAGPSYGMLRRRQIVHELLEEAQQRRALLTALGDLLIELDAAGRVLALPESAGKFLDTPLHQVIGRPLARYCLAGDGPVLQARLAALAAAAQPDRCTLTLRTPRTTLRVQVCPILPVGRRCSGFVLRVQE